MVSVYCRALNIVCTGARFSPVLHCGAALDQTYSDAPLKIAEAKGATTMSSIRKGFPPWRTAKSYGHAARIIVDQEASTIFDRTPRW